MSIAVKDIINGEVIFNNLLQDTELNFPSAKDIFLANNNEQGHLIFKIINSSNFKVSFECDEGIIFKTKNITIFPGETYQFALSIYDNDAKCVHLVQHSPAAVQDYTF